MSADDLFRIVLIAAAALGAAVFVVGGLVTPVAGRWRDGDRVIELWQLGPFVGGRCRRPGGDERYRGLAWFGRVRLDRAVFGRAHLASIGFGDDTIPLVEGQVMARLALRRSGDELRGTFEGRQFTFAYAPRPHIARVLRLEPTDRVWIR